MAEAAAEAAALRVASTAMKNFHAAQEEEAKRKSVSADRSRASAERSAVSKVREAAAAKEAQFMAERERVRAAFKLSQRLLFLRDLLLYAVLLPM